MKSERRHELQTNYLADHLGTAVSTSKPYATYVIGGLVVAVFAALAYGFYSAQVSKASAAAWGDYYFNMASGDAEIFQQVAQDHTGTVAAAWAKQTWADNKLMDGLDQLYTDRKMAEETIKKAIDAYQEVLSKSFENDLKTRANMGLAQAHEAIGKLEEATKYYKQVAASSQDGYATMANNRLAWIASGDGKAFYEWFASTKSVPAVKPNVPFDLSKPPTMPDIKFKDTPATPPAAPTSPDAAAPANPANPAADAPAPTAPANPPAAIEPPKNESTSTPAPATPTPAEPPAPAPAPPAAEPTPAPATPPAPPQPEQPPK